MADRFDSVERTAVIKSTAYTVRAMLHEGVTMLSARDVLEACGIKYPDKWMKRNFELYPDKLKAQKLDFPLMTGCGHRRVKMFFVEASVAKKMVNLTSCAAETKKWLTNEVFPYHIEAEDAPEVANEEPQVMEPVAPAAIPPASIRGEDLNRHIDNLLLELLELKKLIVGGAVGA